MELEKNKRFDILNNKNEVVKQFDNYEEAWEYAKKTGLCLRYYIDPNRLPWE